MWKEHRVGVSVPYLLRTDIDILMIRIHIKEQLRGIEDLVYGLDGVFSLYDRKNATVSRINRKGQVTRKKFPIMRSVAQAV